MNQLGGFPLLTLILFVTGLGALMIWLVPARRVDAWRWLAFLIATATFFISLFIYMGWNNDSETALQFVDGPMSWLSALGFQYHLGVDGISLHLIMLTAFLMPLILLRAWSQGTKSQMAWMVAFETGMLGTLVASDVFLFAAFGSLALVAAAFVIGCDPGTTAQEPTSSVRPRATIIPLLLAGIPVILLLAIVGGQTAAANDGRPMLSVWWAQIGLFGAIAAAMGVTSIGIPRYLGRADAQQGFSPSTCMLVHGLLCTLGIYGMIRFGLLAFPMAVTSLAPAMMIIGLIVAIWNALAMLGTDNWESALTHWVILQVGLDIIGILCMNHLSMQGVILRQIGRALGLSALLIPPQPRTDKIKQLILAVGFLTALGVPGLAGFPGLSAWLMGLLRWHWQVGGPTWINTTLDWAFYGAAAGSLLIAVWALLRLWRSLPSREASPPHSRQTLIAIPLLIAIALLGLQPKAFSDTIGPTVHNAINQFNLDLEQDLGQTATISRQPALLSMPGHPFSTDSQHAASPLEKIEIAVAPRWLH